MGFLLICLGFSGFRGRETETDPPESISGVEDLPPTAGIVGSAGCQIGLVWFSRWVGSSDGFGQPYSLGVCDGFLERHISFYSLVPIPKFVIHVSFYSLVYSSNKIIPWQQSYYNPWLRGKKKHNHIIKLTQYTKSQSKEAQPIVNLLNIYKAHLNWIISCSKISTLAMLFGNNFVLSPLYQNHQCLR